MKSIFFQNLSPTTVCQYILQNQFQLILHHYFIINMNYKTPPKRFFLSIDKRTSYLFSSLFLFFLSLLSLISKKKKKKNQAIQSCKVKGTSYLVRTFASFRTSTDSTSPTLQLARIFCGEFSSHFQSSFFNNT